TRGTVEERGFRLVWLVWLVLLLPRVGLGPLFRPRSAPGPDWRGSSRRARRLGAGRSDHRHPPRRGRARDRGTAEPERAALRRLRHPDPVGPARGERGRRVGPPRAADGGARRPRPAADRRTVGIALRL